MGILQFLRILWARRLIIVGATVSCLVGAMIVVLILPPRWQAHSRVVLELIKPDPVTGQVIASNNSRAYAATQIELIKDYRVAGQVADQLGWLSDPALIQKYEQRPSNDTRDYRRWLAQIVIDRTKAELVEGSNILEITYTASTPSTAKGVADALMKAYIDSSLAFRREEASRSATWFDAQADKAKASLDTAVAAVNAYQRENGIVLQDDKIDVDSARLRALSAQASAAMPMVGPPVAASASSTAELAQIDAAIAQASQSLGPNHPELQAMKSRRAAIQAQIGQERAIARASAGATASAAGAGVGALDRAVAAQKSRVIQQSDKLEHLRQLQAEVDLRREQFNKTAARAADLHQQAMASEAGLTVLGVAATPQQPAFPNMPLIIFGSIGLGLGGGGLLGLLIELFARRVRGYEDLEHLAGAPFLAAIPAPRKTHEKSAGAKAPRDKRLTARPKMAQA